MVMEGRRKIYQSTLISSWGSKKPLIRFSSLNCLKRETPGKEGRAVGMGGGKAVVGIL